MAFKFDSQDDIISEINIVPMVDVILVVLIIFMVTAPMIMKPSISVNLPKSGSGDSTKPSKLNITVDKNGQIQLDGRNVTASEVKTVAQQEYARNQEVQAIIAADKDVSHGQVVSILDIVKAAGVKRFAISIDRK